MGTIEAYSVDTPYGILRLGLKDGVPYMMRNDLSSVMGFAWKPKGGIMSEDLAMGRIWDASGPQMATMFSPAGVAVTTLCAKSPRPGFLVFYMDVLWPRFTGRDTGRDEALGFLERRCAQADGGSGLWRRYMKAMGALRDLNSVHLSGCKGQSL